MTDRPGDEQTPPSDGAPTGDQPTTPQDAEPQPVYRPTAPLSSPGWQPDGTAGPPAHPGQSAYPGLPAYPGQPGYQGQPYPGQPHQGQGYPGTPPPGAVGYSGTQPLPHPGQGAGPGYPGGAPSGYPGAPTPPTGPPQVTARERRGPGAGMLTVLAVVIAVVAALGGGLVGAALVGAGSGTSTTMTVANNGDQSPAPKGSVQEVAQKVLPSVVSIQNVSGRQASSGSGVVLSADGKVVTNNHVIAGNGTLTVTFSDGSTSAARVIGADPVTDLAVIQTEKQGLTPIVIGDSAKLAVGQGVVAVGAPLGLSSTVTSGIVSALNRPVATSGRDSDEATVVNSVQTDAAINPGNSGGALVNMSGQLVGINSSIASLGARATGGQAGSIGLGFAIPSDLVKRIATELMSGGQATHAELGVSVAPGAESAAEPGAVVVNVRPDGPAGRAGIPDNARVTQVDDLQITDGIALIGAVRSFPPGTKVKVTYVPKGSSQDKTAEVTLGTLDR